jgi:hypothetical protein
MRRLFCLLAVIAGCGILEPDEACGCTPQLFSTPVAGEVLDSSDEPVSGVLVITESALDDADAATPTCSAPGQMIARNATQTNANGQFSSVVRWTGTPSCARIWAQAGSGAQLRSSDTTVFPLELKSSSLPVGLVLHLRDPASP